MEALLSKQMCESVCRMQCGVLPASCSLREMWRIEVLLYLLFRKIKTVSCDTTGWFLDCIWFEYRCCCCRCSACKGGSITPRWPQLIARLQTSDSSLRANMASLSSEWQWSETVLDDESCRWVVVYVLVGCSQKPSQEEKAVWLAGSWCGPSSSLALV